MTVTLSKKFDFCGCKNIFKNNKKIGDVLKEENYFLIRVSKNRNDGSQIHKEIKTDNENMIICLIRNFLNQH